ncbi:hypothetical protein C5Y97_28505 [Blastopirellula marina]|uniref:Uncharacterized protein n=1 Tax=Blastopirellula marina TaxID=124 RepID=A0A2S8F4V1_9BACT|nr:hypothetical protein C5Y98_28490 [Blastopirellula marina]PTL41333.1 hypothetical protein C5Y97_28505 [Blastopirellula marina]
MPLPRQQDPDPWTTPQPINSPASSWLTELGLLGPLGCAGGAILVFLFAKLGLVGPRVIFSLVILLTLIATACCATDRRRQNQPMLQAMFVAGCLMLLVQGLLLLDFLSVPSSR